MSNHSLIIESTQQEANHMAKVWLITGSGNGLGRDIAEAALAAGDSVVAGARRLEELNPLVEQYGERITPVTLDVRDESAAKAAVQTAVEKYGRLDVLVNNAGYGFMAPFEQTPEGDPNFPRNPKRSAPTRAPHARYWYGDLNLHPAEYRPPWHPRKIHPMHLNPVRLRRPRLAASPRARRRRRRPVRLRRQIHRHLLPTLLPLPPPRAQKRQLLPHPRPRRSRRLPRLPPLRAHTHTPKADPQAEAIAKAATFLTTHAGQRTKLDDLATASGLGKFALQRGFKRVLGVTPGDFAREQRKDRFREKVRTPKLSITDAVYEAGFGSSSRLYEGVDQTLGMSPTAMKSGGAGETIHYTTTDSPLGRLLVATTDRGLCAVLFGDTDADLAIELREQFPQAVLRLSTSDEQLTEAVTFVLSRLTEHPTAQTLPFHVRATAFQQRVWQALLEIPRGETRTYSQIAEAVGSPKAVRAVGTACGSNLLAVVIPCHRVVGSDGKLTGYRWGTDRKRQLLELEHQPNVQNRVEAHRFASRNAC
jgi:AraC family transcriptional regulator of adaptative response/methylated-DNA-[protein]-cysteine methyltransferase